MAYQERNVHCERCVVQKLLSRSEHRRLQLAVHAMLLVTLWAGGVVLGSFFDTTTVPLPRYVATPVPFDTTDFADGVSIVDGTKITMAVGGKFNIMFSSQLEKGDAGTDLVSVWLAKDGVSAAWTNTDVVITASGANSRHVVAWNFFVEAEVGTYFQLMMTSTTSSQMVIRSVASQMNPTRPEIPGAILTVQQVG